MGYTSNTCFIDVMCYGLQAMWTFMFCLCFRSAFTHLWRPRRSTFTYKAQSCFCDGLCLLAVVGVSAASVLECSSLLKLRCIGACLADHMEGCSAHFVQQPMMKTPAANRICNFFGPLPVHKNMPRMPCVS